jgi:hypothetical protein
MSGLRGGWRIADSASSDVVSNAIILRSLRYDSRVAIRQIDVTRARIAKLSNGALSNHISPAFSVA